MSPNSNTTTLAAVISYYRTITVYNDTSKDSISVTFRPACMEMDNTIIPFYLYVCTFVFDCNIVHYKFFKISKKNKHAKQAEAKPRPCHNSESAQGLGFIFLKP